MADGRKTDHEDRGFVNGVSLLDDCKYGHDCDHFGGLSTINVEIVIFLASDEATYIAGEKALVNGTKKIDLR